MPVQLSDDCAIVFKCLSQNFFAPLDSPLPQLLCYALLFCTLLTGPAAGAPIDQASIDSAADSGNWLTNGLTYDEQRFSPTATDH